jgi:hypothetical protein
MSLVVMIDGCARKFTFIGVGSEMYLPKIVHCMPSLGALLLVLADKTIHDPWNKETHPQDYCKCSDRQRVAHAQGAVFPYESDP